MESQADLEAKIALYNQQLGQVDELLQLDATNAEFLKLKSDLQQLITLTRALLVKVISGSSPGLAPATGVSSSIANISSSTLQSSNAGAPVTIRKGPIQVGEVVEVTGGDRIYAGVVKEIINQTEYKIKYFEFPTEVSLPVSSLQRPGLSYYLPDQVTMDMACQCKYAADQTYYDCKVTGVTEHGYTVTYTEYGNSEEVPINYLKPRTSAAKPPSAFGGKSLGKHSANGGLIPIPDSLQILPTDTEKEIEKKKKELKSIKNKNRLIQQEVEAQEAQQSWKKFVTKGSKRPDSGLTAKKGSMFSSTEEVAGKVGVVNSGKGMTTFEPRKKHKFDTF